MVLFQCLISLHPLPSYNKIPESQDNATNNPSLTAHSMDKNFIGGKVYEFNINPQFPDVCMNQNSNTTLKVRVGKVNVQVV